MNLGKRLRDLLALFGESAQKANKDMLVSNKDACISKILDLYGDYDAEELEAMTHNELPWLNARRGLPKWAYSDIPINDDDITRFYVSEFSETFNHLKNSI